MERYNKKFKESNDHRVTNGDYTVYEIYAESDKQFASKFKDKGEDVFFFKDENIAVTVSRTTSLIWNGKKGDFKLLDQIKYIYASYEDEFYKPLDFSKLIIGIYHGRKSRVSPIHI